MANGVSVRVWNQRTRNRTDMYAAIPQTMTPTPGSKPTLQARLVAVTLADLAGRALGSAVPYRAER